MKAYIKNSCAISPQVDFNGGFPPQSISVYESEMHCIEPNYKEYFPPLKIRRMSRLVKMGLTASKVCLANATLEMPEAVITATGWGCLEDTFKFLDDIASKDNITPSPATFIQSTHNTPGGQIALFLQCQGYNNVFVNGNKSFEYALIDSVLLLKEGGNNILVGGLDEISDKDLELKRRAEYWKPNGISNTDMLKHKSKGSIPGEGSTFFLLSSEKLNCSSCISDVSIFHCPDIEKGLNLKIENFLKTQNLGLSDIDIVLSGKNGDINIDEAYNSIENLDFKNADFIYYKQLCGEYDTSSAYALWLADKIIANQKIPNFTQGKNPDNRRNIDHILIYNYCSRDKHAIILVSNAKI